MKIELKNIKHMESLSEETNCYTASLHVDGKKIGEVSNHGHGGPDMFHGDQAAYDEANSWIKANEPPLDSEYGDFQLKWKGVRKVEEAHIAVARKKLPGAKILNDLPFDEALALYIANG